MIHTMDIRYRTTRKKAQILLEELADENDVTRFFDNPNARFEQDVYCYMGFNKVVVYPVPGGNGYYIINLVINPAVLAFQQRTIRLFDCSVSAIERLKQAFKDRMSDMTSAKLPTIDRWHVGRIDYAIDIETLYADKLAALAKRVEYPWRYCEKYDGRGSAYFGCKSVTLNFYDKLDQVRKDHSRLSYFDRLQEEAANKFRVEVQCFSAKVKAIRHTYSLPDTHSLTLLNANIAAEIVSNYYAATLGTEEFVSMAEAKKRIGSSGWQKPKQDRVLDMLQLLSQARKIPNAKEQYVMGTKIKNDKSDKVVKGTRSQFGTYLNDCSGLGFNPVILPRDWRIRTLQNPISQLRI